MYVTVYNNRIFTERGLEDLFDVVNDNRWTMEYQYELANDLYVDLNNIGERDDGDFYGFVSGARTSVDSYWVSCKAWVIGRDENNYYTYIGSTDRISGMVDQVLNLYYNCDGSYIIPYGDDNTDNAEIVNIFSKGNVAMANMKIQAIETGLQNLDFDEYDVRGEEAAKYVYSVFSKALRFSLSGGTPMMIDLAYGEGNGVQSDRRKA